MKILAAKVLQISNTKYKHYLMQLQYYLRKQKSPVSQCLRVYLNKQKSA